MESCICCRSPVPDERVEFLRETGRALTCVNCTGERARLVLMDYGHKTAGFAVPIPQSKEAERLAVRCYRRAR